LSSKHPPIKPMAVSLGDPAGVGPELLAAAWYGRSVHALPAFCAIGGAGLLAQAAQCRRLDVPIARVGSLEEAAQAFGRALPVLGDFDGDYTPGEPDMTGAQLALDSLTMASRLAVAGEASALITGPTAKSRLAEVGFDYPGQTEFVAAAAGVAAQDAVMMLAGPSLRNMHGDRHGA
jgi:4-hydroxythreonine-4-phosphate dehydrogenase